MPRMQEGSPRASGARGFVSVSTLSIGDSGIPHHGVTPNMTPDDIRCPSCGDLTATIAIPPDPRCRHEETVCGVTVIDCTELVLICGKCGAPSYSAQQAERYELRAVALVLRDGRHVDKSIVRSVCHALGLSPSGLAMALELPQNVVLGWEQGVPMLRREQLAIASICDAVREGQFDIKWFLEPVKPKMKPPFELTVSIVK